MGRQHVEVTEETLKWRIATKVRRAAMFHELIHRRPTMVNNEARLSLESRSDRHAEVAGRVGGLSTPYDVLDENF